MTKPSAPRPGRERAGRAHFPIVSEAQPATLPRRGVLCGHVVAAVGLLHRLLPSTDLSVAASARAVGWTDPNYSSHCFRTSCGISATAFRCRRAARQGESSEEIVALVAPSIGRYLA